jgi:hypothetical protein
MFTSFVFPLRLFDVKEVKAVAYIKEANFQNNKSESIVSQMFGDGQFEALIVADRHHPSGFRHDQY